MAFSNNFMVLFRHVQDVLLLCGMISIGCYNKDVFHWSYFVREIRIIVKRIEMWPIIRVSNHVGDQD